MNTRTFLIAALCAVLVSVVSPPAAGQSWRPTVDNDSRYPPGLPAPQRAKVLASLDALLPAVRAALDTQGVQFQAQRSFADEPQFPQGPWPLNLHVGGYEQQADGTFEGEYATNIEMYVNDLGPLLSIALDEPRIWILKEDPVKRTHTTNFGHFGLLSKGGVLPFKAVSKEEYARRVEAWLTRRKDDKALARLRADFAALSPAQRAEPMLLPKAFSQESKAWPGFTGGVRPVVDIDTAYFDPTKRDVPQIIVMQGSVAHGDVRDRAVKRLAKFWKTLDYEQLRALLR